MCYIKSSNIPTAHKEILKRILKPEDYPAEDIGVYLEVEDQDGNVAREVHNVLVTIENPLDEDANYELATKEELDFYATCHTDEKCAKDEGFIPGQRLFNFLGINQYDKIKELIMNVETSRRASIITCNPLTDWDTSRPPCLLLIDLKVRENKLLMTGVLRSNDMYRTWPANTYALAKLQKKFSDEIGIAQGHLDILSISAHIYKDDFKKANRAYQEP